MSVVGFVIFFGVVFKDYLKIIFIVVVGDEVKMGVEDGLISDCIIIVNDIYVNDIFVSCFDSVGDFRNLCKYDVGKIMIVIENIGNVCFWYD